MADNINQNLTDLVDCLKGLTDALSAQASSDIGDSQSEGSDGQVSIGLGQDFDQPEDYYGAKCNAANWIFDGLLETITWLDDYEVDLLAGGSVGIGVTMVAALAFLGPPGWAAGLAEVTIVAVVTLLTQYVFNLGDIKSALTSSKTDLIHSLYNGASTTQAKASFEAVLDGASPALTSIEISLVMLLVTTDHLNNLFAPKNEVRYYEPLGAVSCPTASQVWTFAASGEGWAFRELSTGGYSSSATWEASREAWEITLSGPGTSHGPQAKGAIYLDGLSIASTPANAIQFDYGPTSDGVSARVYAKVTYTDDTTEQYEQATPGIGGTLVLSLTETKTIKEIEVATSRNWSKSFTITRDFNEVRFV